MSESEITEILRAVNAREQGSVDRLIERVQRELHDMARGCMAGERPGHTLQATALVNEACVRLLDDRQSWEGRAHFFGAAAEAMRRILIDHARKRAADKRGGAFARVTFSDLNVEAEDPDIDVVALNEALDALAASDQRLAEVVRLRYFAGLTIEDVAEVMKLSPATVKRDWAYARAWLLERMMDVPDSDAGNATI